MPKERQLYSCSRETKTLERTVRKRLEKHFGRPEWREPLAPIDELVSTILSQNTNDMNRDMAFYRLKHRFVSWEAVRDADEDEVIEAIRPAGLGNQKGPRIQDVLRQISEQRGSLELDFLKELPFEEAHAWLMQFKGVGRKTAAIVLLFALGVPDFPVDTHIYRVTERLALRPAGLSLEQAHDYLAGLIPPEEYYTSHLNLIRLGRELCHARKPDCLHCPLNNICAYYLNVVSKA